MSGHKPWREIRERDLLHDRVGRCVDERCSERGMEHGHRSSSDPPRSFIRPRPTAEEALYNLGEALKGTGAARLVERVMVWLLDSLTRTEDAFTRRVQR